jgi:hypothetical protein
MAHFRGRPARYEKVAMSGNSPNAIIFSVISLLREDPLSPGMLDMFFVWNIVSCVSSRKRVYILKIAQIFNSFNSNDLN